MALKWMQLILTAAAAVFLIASPPGVQSCKCMPPTFNRTICEADWVSHVEVLSNRTSEQFIVYSVKHLELFKVANSSEANLTAGRTGDLLTPLHDATCGVTDLQTGADYLLAGTLDQSGNPRLYLCLYVPLEDGKPNPVQQPGYLDWESVPERMRARLAHWREEVEC